MFTVSRTDIASLGLDFAFTTKILVNIFFSDTSNLMPVKEKLQIRTELI